MQKVGGRERERKREEGGERGERERELKLLSRSDSIWPGYPSFLMAFAAAAEAAAAEAAAFNAAVIAAAVAAALQLKFCSLSPNLQPRFL